MRTTATKSARTKLSSTAAIGGYTQTVARDDTMPVRHEPGFKEALSTMQRLKRAEDKKKQEATAQPSLSSSSWHWQVQLVGVRLRALASKMVLPLRQHGETRILSGSLLIGGRDSTYRRIWIFSLSLVIMQSVTADGSLRSPTGGVEESYPTPHIHEQKTTSNYI